MWYSSIYETIEERELIEIFERYKTAKKKLEFTKFSQQTALPLGLPDVAPPSSQLPTNEFVGLL